VQFMRVGPLSSWLHSACFFKNKNLIFNFFLAGGFGGGGGLSKVGEMGRASLFGCLILFLYGFFSIILFSRIMVFFKKIRGEILHEVSDWKDRGHGS
jgi:hypothetical protein